MAAKSALNGAEWSDITSAAGLTGIRTDIRIRGPEDPDGEHHQNPQTEI